MKHPEWSNIQNLLHLDWSYQTQDLETEILAIDALILENISFFNNCLGTWIVGYCLALGLH